MESSFRLCKEPALGNIVVSKYSFCTSCYNSHLKFLVILFSPKSTDILSIHTLLALYVSTNLCLSSPHH